MISVYLWTSIFLYFSPPCAYIVQIDWYPGLQRVKAFSLWQHTVCCRLVGSYHFIWKFFYFISFCILAACQPLEVTCKCVHFNPSVHPFVMRNSSNVSLCCHFFAKIFDGISSLSSLHPLSYSSPQNVCFFPTLQMESDFVLLPLDVILSLCIMMGVGIKTYCTTSKSHCCPAEMGICILECASLILSNHHNRKLDNKVNVTSSSFLLYE